MHTEPPWVSSHGGKFRRATVSYLAALGLIGLLSAGLYAASDAMIRGQAETARVVNVAGRQRMLSQRIAGLAVEMALPAGQTQGAALGRTMEAAVARMEAAHRALTQGSAAMGIEPSHSPAMTAIYRGAPYRLDARLTAFVGLARAYLALPPDRRAASPELARLLALAHRPLLDALDAAVGQYQKESEAAIRRLRLTMLGVVAVILLTLVAEARFLFRPMLLKLHDAQAELLDLALTDPLTGCKNRRYLMEIAAHEVARARRLGAPLSVLMLDIDHFKHINDTWGHAVGDEAIVTLARTLLANLRANDLVGRIGGEEFAAVLPGTVVADAQVVAEKLRTAVAEQVVRGDWGEMDLGGITMTVSVGVSTLRPADPDFMTILERADQALYAAKQSGRNRVLAAVEA